MTQDSKSGGELARRGAATSVRIPAMEGVLGRPWLRAAGADFVQPAVLRHFQDTVTTINALTMPPPSAFMLAEELSERYERLILPAIPSLVRQVAGIDAALKALGVRVASEMTQVQLAVKALATASVGTDWVKAFQLQEHVRNQVLDAITDSNWRASVAQQMFTAQQVQMTAATASIASIVATRADLFSVHKLASGLSAYAGTQAIIGTSALDVDLLRGSTLGASRGLDRYLGSLGARPTPRRATLAGLAGHGVAGLMASEALLTPNLDGDEIEELSQEFTTTVLEPWQSAPARAREDLYGELTRIDPALADLLKGAWDDIDRDGPAAVAKAAHCLQEVIDWTLRQLASDEETHAFLSVNAMIGTRYISNGKLTRTARVEFVVQARSRGDKALIRKYGNSVASLLSELTSAIQGRKHGGQIVTVTASGIRSQALAVESWLTMLLFGPQ